MWHSFRMQDLLYLRSDEKNIATHQPRSCFSSCWTIHLSREAATKMCQNNSPILSHIRYYLTAWNEDPDPMSCIPDNCYYVRPKELRLTMHLHGSHLLHRLVYDATFFLPCLALPQGLRGPNPHSQDTSPYPQYAALSLNLHDQPKVALREMQPSQLGASIRTPRPICKVHHNQQSHKQSPNTSDHPSPTVHRSAHSTSSSLILHE